MFEQDWEDYGLLFSPLLPLDKLLMYVRMDFNPLRQKCMFLLTQKR